MRPGLEAEVGRPGGRQVADATTRVAGRLHPKLAGRIAVKEVAAQDAVFYDGISAGRQSFAIKRLRTQIAGQCAVIVNRDSLRGDLLTQLADQKRRPAVERRTGECRAEQTHETGGGLSVKDYRGLLGLDLARAQALEGSLGCALSDHLRRLQRAQVSRARVPVIALHAVFG